MVVVSGRDYDSDEEISARSANDMYGLKAEDYKHLRYRAERLDPRCSYKFYKWFKRSEMAAIAERKEQMRKAAEAARIASALAARQKQLDKHNIMTTNFPEWLFSGVFGDFLNPVVKPATSFTKVNRAYKLVPLILQTAQAAPKKGLNRVSQGVVDRYILTHAELFAYSYMKNITPKMLLNGISSMRRAAVAMLSVAEARAKIAAFLPVNEREPFETEAVEEIEIWSQLVENAQNDVIDEFVQEERDEAAAYEAAIDMHIHNMYNVGEGGGSSGVVKQEVKAEFDVKPEVKSEMSNLCSAPAVHTKVKKEKKAAPAKKKGKAKLEPTYAYAEDAMYEGESDDESSRYTHKKVDGDGGGSSRHMHVDVKDEVVEDSLKPVEGTESRAGRKRKARVVMDL